MPELNEYDITESNGVVTRVQLSDDDAKKMPHAKRVGTHARKGDEGGEGSNAAGATAEHEPVHNRARKQA